MSLYDEFSDTARDLLTEYGQTAYIRRSVETAAEHAPWEAPETETKEYPCIAIVLSYHESVLAGSTIHAGDKKIIVAAKGLEIEPTMTDVVLCNGVAYNIVNVETVAPAGVPIVYRLQARV